METADVEKNGSCLPLAGHVLFASTRWKRINESELQKNIQSLGGKLETFFSHEITCVLTDELSVPAKRDVLKRSQNGQLLSQETKCSSIVDKAKALGIQVMRIETFLTWLRMHGNMPAKVQEVKRPSKPNSITKLNGCFMKIEHESQNYSPVYKVYSGQPDLEFERLYYDPVECDVSNDASSDSRSKTDFSVDIKLPKLLKTEDNKQTKKTESSSSSELPKNNNKGKRHYCECCKMYFSCMNTHLKGPQHLKFVSNEDNFKELTALTSNINSVAEFKEKVSNGLAVSPQVKPEILRSTNVAQSVNNPVDVVEKKICVKSIILENVKPKVEVNLDVNKFRDELSITDVKCDATTALKGVKHEDEKQLNAPAYLEENLLELFTCKNLTPSDPLTEVLKIEELRELNREKNELGRILTQTFPGGQDDLQENEPFGEKTLMKDELDFNDLFPSDMLPDNDRLFSSDISDDESIHRNIQNIIRNVFDERTSSNDCTINLDGFDREMTRTLDNASNISDQNVPVRTHELSKKHIRNLYVESWAIRPITDIKMLFLRCSVLRDPKDAECNTWIVKSITDTKLVLTRSRCDVRC